ncbi:MAG: 30S ribosome-binding factor RbfA [Deltaproteobacteria bacterium]|nr:30S ribosome-binding factor RbfA [Deltaproteobacteria bacterium]
MARRAERVGELIQRELGAMIERGALKDPAIGFVTITGVDVTADLKQARIYYSVYGDAGAQAGTQAALERARGFVRRELGQRLRLKATPEVEFRVDRSIERAARIEQILRQVRPAGEPGTGVAQGEEEDGEDPASH